MIDILKTAVVTLRQKMEAAFTDEPIKPSTFPDKDGVGQYLTYDNAGVKDAVLDTHQSQANRIEPLFDGTGLIPDSTVKDSEKVTTVTRLGHRLADAAIYFSDKVALAQDAMKAFVQGNAVPIAKLSPTSLLFGLWDSRAERSRAKVTRIFNSEIRAHNVIEVPTAGQYISSVSRIEGQVSKDLSAEGLLDCPYSGKGGVLVKGEIVRSARLNIRGIRALKGATAEQTAKLQNYVLGLGLYALVAPASGDLREGCNLVSTSTRIAVLNEDGTREELELKYNDVVAFAKQAAQDFGVGNAVEFIYNPTAAGSASGKAEKLEEKAKTKKIGKVKEAAAVVA